MGVLMVQNNDEPKKPSRRRKLARTGPSAHDLAEIAAATELGMRFHPTRGSMSLSQKDGGLPPDSVVQDDDEILAENKTEWAKASSLIKRARRPSGWLRPQLLWVYLALMLASVSLYFLLQRALLFGALSVFVLVMVLMKITNDQVRRR
jgi:hypothetical protein